MAVTDNITPQAELAPVPSAADSQIDLYDDDPAGRPIPDASLPDSDEISSRRRTAAHEAIAALGVRHEQPLPSATREKHAFVTNKVVPGALAIGGISAAYWLVKKIF